MVCSRLMHVRGEESHWTELYLHVRGVILLVDAEYRFTKFTTWAYYLYPNSGYHLHLLYVHMKKHDGLLQFVCVQLFFYFWLKLSILVALASPVHTYIWISTTLFFSLYVSIFFGWTLTETNWMAPQSVHTHESAPPLVQFCMCPFVFTLTKANLMTLASSVYTYIHMNQHHSFSLWSLPWTTTDAW